MAGRNEQKVALLEKTMYYVTHVAWRRAFKSAVKKIAEKLVKGTPVYFEDLDTSGSTKGNWKVTLGDTPDKSYDPNTRDKDGAATISAIRGAVEAFQLPDDTKIILSNSSPAMMSLEYGLYPNPPKAGSRHPITGAVQVRSTGGYSKQAPKGIVGVVGLEWEKIIEEENQKAKAKIRGTVK